MPPASIIVADATLAPSLPTLVRSAAAKLAAAESSAQVLDARDAATLAYDTAKRAARMMTAKRAHDELVAAAYHAQADALAIECAAKRRLADEYDAAKERGDVAPQGKPSRAEGLHLADPRGGGEPSKATVADIGLTRRRGGVTSMPERLHDRHRRCPVAIFDPDDSAYVASLYAVERYEAADIRIALLDQFHGGLLDGSVVDAVFRAEGWSWPGEITA